MPDEFKNLALDAVDHNPESRPKLTTMFIVLSDCLESFDSHTFSSKYMTHAAEAAKKHEMFGLIAEIRDLLDKIVGVNSLRFNTTIKNKIHPEEALKSDQDELNNYFEIAKIRVDNEDNKKKLLKNCRDFAS
ncbi:unnamed protein product [Rhizophagus irregularis]|nr:unnamed protein product [Rhizophagus irregularis]